MARVILFLLIVAIAVKYSHQQATEATTEAETEGTTVAATEPATVPTPTPRPPPPPPPTCRRRNEVYKRCRSCEPSCRFPSPRCRSRVCRSGCQCRRGFFRRSDGACVTRRGCRLPRRG